MSDHSILQVTFDSVQEFHAYHSKLMDLLITASTTASNYASDPATLKIPETSIKADLDLLGSAISETERFKPYISVFAWYLHHDLLASDFFHTFNALASVEHDQSTGSVSFCLPNRLTQRLYFVRSHSGWSQPEKEASQSLVFTAQQTCKGGDPKACMEQFDSDIQDLLKQYKHNTESVWQTIIKAGLGKDPNWNQTMSEVKSARASILGVDCEGPLELLLRLGKVPRD